MTLLKRLLAPLLLLALTAGFYWKLSLSRDFVWFDHPDMVHLEIPRLQYEAKQIHGKHFPLWDARIWAGQPLIGQTQPGPVYPLNLLYCMLPLRNGYIRLDVLNWYWVAIHFLALLFCYRLARDLGRCRAAAVLAGCVFSFGGFTGTAAWLDVVNGAVWTPLTVLFLLRALRGRQPAASAALSGVSLGLAWLSGHHEIPMLVTAALAVTWAFYIFRRGRPDFGLLRLAALSLGIAALVSAVQTWPTYEFGSRSLRWVGIGPALAWNDRVPYASPAMYSLSARGLLGTLVPMGRDLADSSAFLGLMAVAAAALGVLVYWRDRTVRWLLALAAAALVYALGALTPVHGVVYSLVPGLNKARVPVRALHLFQFGIAALAAYGFDALLERRDSPWVRRIALAAAALGALVLGAAVVSSVEDRLVLWALVAVASAAVWLAWRAGQLGRGAAVTALAALLLVELYGPATAWFSDRNKAQAGITGALNRYDDIAAFLFTQPRPVRALVLDQDVPLDFGDWYGIDTYLAYTAGVTENIATHPFHTERTQKLFGVTHLVASKPDRPDQPLLFTGASGVRVFGNPGALPRAWAVHEVVRMPDRNALLDRIQEPGFDPARTALMLEQAPALAACSGPDEVRLAVHDPGRVILTATLACRGMVVLSETMFPGWRAKVDGRAVPIYEVYGAFRGVVVEAGTHRIDFAYRPVSVYGGLALTLAGLAISAVTVVRSRADFSPRRASAGQPG